MVAGAGAGVGAVVGAGAGAGVGDADVEVLVCLFGFLAGMLLFGIIFLELALRSALWIAKQVSGVWSLVWWK